MAENTNTMDWASSDWLTKGLAIAGTATGITALAIKQGKNNGCKNGNNSDGEDCYITRMESKLRAENAELKADSKTDAKILDLFRVVSNNKEEAGKQIAENAVQIALNKQATDFQFAATNREFVHSNRRIDRVEARIDEVTEEIIPISKICPQPLSGSQSIGIQGCIIPTEPTDLSVTAVRGRAKA